MASNLRTGLPGFTIAAGASPTLGTRPDGLTRRLTASLNMSSDRIGTSIHRLLRGW